jgi:haloacetate dehalogenase
MAEPAFFPGFRAERFVIDGVGVHAVIGGAGRPLMLVHGAPQSGIMWRHIAPKLAERFTLIIPDLRGYGRSDKPAQGDYSKRRMALDLVGVMDALGHKQFFLAGHDRGARVSRRLAKDHPTRVKKLAILDIVPTTYIFENLNPQRAKNLWHWFALSLDYPAPEMLLGPQASAFVRGGAGLAKAEAAAVEDYLATNATPEAFHAMCQDYRAGAGVDLLHDAADAGVKLSMPTLVVWGEKSQSTGAAFDVPAAWALEGAGIQFASLPCGHFLPEEMPAETLAHLQAFFSA